MKTKADSSVPDPFAVALGVRVKEEREKRGWTKETLGERAELASRYIWRVEDGRQNIQLKNLVRIAIALEMTISDLTAGIEQRAGSGNG